VSTLRDVALSVASLYALVLLCVGYLTACNRAANWAEARRITRATTPQKGETP
jgi:hypothetical protein